MDKEAHDKVCPSKAFDDLDTSLWYHEGTDFVISEGMMNGVGEKTFAPNDTPNVSGFDIRDITLVKIG